MAPPRQKADVHRVVISHDPTLCGNLVVLLFLARVTTRCFTFRSGADDDT